jgi:hypothetical protein
VADQSVTLSIYRCADLFNILKQVHLQPDFLGGDAETGALAGLATIPGARVSADPRVTGSTAPDDRASSSAARRAALAGTHSFGVVKVQNKFTRWETTYAKAWFPHDAETVLIELAHACFKDAPFANAIPRNRPVPWTPSRRMKAVE